MKMEKPALQPTPHAHGGNAAAALRRYGLCETAPVIDFSVNINPLGPPDLLRSRWAGWFDCLSSYPSSAGISLEKFYRDRFGLPEGSVVGGNGSIELIYLAPRALAMQHALIFTPSFHDYRRACETARIPVVSRSLMDHPGAPYQWDQRALSLVEKADAVFMGNPNNPTGSVLPAQALLDLAEAFPRTWFLIDEAFSQFLEDPEPYSLLRRDRLRKNIVVFHSLTKFYALPGLRMGAAVSHPETADRLRCFKEPWTVNAVAERAAALLLDCRAYERRTRDVIREERRFLARALGALPGVEVYPPTANFLFLRLRNIPDLDPCLAGLLKQGIFVRDCRNFDGLDGSYVRLAVRGPEDNRQLVRAFTRVLGDSHA